MAKIYERNKYLEMLLDSVDEKFTNGDYLGSLDAINKLQNINGETLFILAKRARVFYAMNRYSLANREWFKYLSKTSNKKDYAIAYNGLGASFYKMGEDGVAGYYFKMQILEDKGKSHYYYDVLKEYYEEKVFSKDNYYLAYPYDIADFTKTIEKAERLMKNGNFEGVIDTLQIIPENSKFYPTSLVITSIAKFFLGDAEGAVLDVEKSISIEPTIASVCNAISMFTSMGNKEKADYYVEMLPLVKSNNGEDDNKICMIYCERGEDLLAESYAKNYLLKNPYDSVMLMLAGMISYNLKKYDFSEYYFKKAYKISKSYNSKYYLDLCESKSVERLSYNLDILDSDRKKILKRIGELITADNSYRLDNQEEIYSLSSYAFTNENYQIQSSIITLLGEISTKKSYEIMKDALINPIVFDRVKSGVIGFLVADGFEEEISVVFSNVFKKITLYRAEFDRNNGVFVEAYAYLYARLSHLEDDFEPIKNSTEIIYKKLVEKDLIREIKDVKSLSAVIYELSSIADIKSRREFASFFDANLREIKRIKSLIL